MLRHACIGALALALAAFPAQAADEGAPQLAAFWRTFFARPAAGATPSPADNPASPEKQALGQKLFLATLLSADESRACASCHDPARAYTDGRAHAQARDGGDLTRNAPTLIDLAWAKSLTWDGRADSLEAQAELPITHPLELGGDWGVIIGRIKRLPELDVAFHVAFTERPAVQPNTIVKALAAYVRTLTSPETAFDRWVKGDDAALTPEQMAGFRLFVGKAGCVSCHGTWRFTDDRYHDIGLASTDPGRGAVPGGVAGLAAFKTPTLRELTRTAPYMHDGSLATLDDVVAHYAGKLTKRPSLSANLVRDLDLDAGERSALVAFLRSLSSQPGGQ